MGHAGPSWTSSTQLTTVPTTHATPLASIHTLPTELLSEILLCWYSLTSSAPETAIRVCRSWRSNAFSVSALWRTITLTSGETARDRLQLWQERSHDQLEHLRLIAPQDPRLSPFSEFYFPNPRLSTLRSLECDLPEWMRYDILRAVPQLRHLRVKSSTGPAVHIRWELLATLDRLEILDLVHAYPQDDRPLPFPHLRAVRLQAQEGAHLLRFLLKTCANLPLEEASLALTSCADKPPTQPNDRDLANLGSAVGQYPRLEHLLLRGKMDWHLLTSRLYLPALQKVVMADFPSPSAAACFGDIKPLSAPVRSLTLTTADHLALEEGLSILIQLEGVPTLEHLRIQGYLSDTFLDGLGEALLPKLTHVDLSGCEGITPEALVRLAIARVEGGCPLWEMTVDGCAWVDLGLVDVLMDLKVRVGWESRARPLVQKGWRSWTVVNT